MTPLQPGVLVPTATATLTAAVGAFVAYQGYRGYRRNDSQPMLYLAVGIFLLTTGAFLARLALQFAGVGGPAGGQVAALAVSICGLLAVLYSFTGA